MFDNQYASHISKICVIYGNDMSKIIGLLCSWIGINVLHFYIFICALED
jgi:hypothetical protein